MISLISRMIKSRPSSASYMMGSMRNDSRSSLYTATPQRSIMSNKASARINLASASSCVVGLRSEEHTSELQSRGHLVCRLLLEKKKDIQCKPLQYSHRRCGTTCSTEPQPATQR